MPLIELGGQDRIFHYKGQRVIEAANRTLQLRGPVLEVVIASPPAAGVDVAPVNGLAMIDTGATRTAVDASIFDSFGTHPTDLIEHWHAGGKEVRPCYAVQISFPGTPLQTLTLQGALSVQLNYGRQPYVALLGRDFLKDLYFTYNGPRGRIEIAF